MATGPLLTTSVNELFLLPRKEHLAGASKTMTPTNLRESANDGEEEQEEGQTASINLMDAHKR